VIVLSAIDWLLESEDASIRYRTLADLIGVDKNDNELQKLKKKLRSQHRPDH